MSDRRIVMLGCGGYIGSHLLDWLLATPGTSIFGIDLESEKIQQHLDNPKFDFVAGDLASPESIARLDEEMDRADVVVNLAAICNPAEYNTEPLRVLEANLFHLYPVIRMCAEKKKWIVHFSTSEVYGRTLASYVPDNTYDESSLYVMSEDSTPLVMGPVRNQRWTYAAAKQVVERLLFAYHSETGMPFTVIRPLNFFGPRMDYLPGHDGEGTPRVLASFMSALIDNKPIRLVDGGSARRTILSIDDAMDAIMRILERPQRSQNQFFNLGNPHNEVTMRQLAELMRSLYSEITGDARYAIHPMTDVSSLDFYGPGYEDCDRRMPDISAARTLLDWEPKKTLRTTLLETMNSFHAAYATEPSEVA